MNRKLLQACIVCCALQLVISCKKDHTNDPPKVATDKVKDTTLEYTREIYLWYDQIPSNYDAQKFATPADIMKDIRQFSKVTGYAEPVDRFSFAMKKTEWDNMASGIEQDFGLNPFFLEGTEQLYVKSVEKESPAGLAGVQRGWRIKAINGSTDINTTDASVQKIVKAVFESASTKFTFLKPDNTEVDITLNAATYNAHPVMVDSVLTVQAGSKVGYMVFDSFLGDTSQVAADFKRVFGKFEKENVSDIIIDLRYNGGGYTTLAGLLSNYLAPLSANGKIMMTMQFNNKNSQYNETTKVSKIGNLNIPRIFFIVSDHTASASEMLINNLLPFMDVKLVGTYAHTYGKPVGFFPIPVGDWYIFPVSFKTVNSQNNSNYYEGFKADKVVYDGVNKNWCDVNESCLASTLQYIKTGAFAANVRSTSSGSMNTISNIHANDQLKGKKDIPLSVGKQIQ